MDKDKIESVLKEIKGDESLRREVAYLIAREFPKEYLDNVLIKANNLNDLAADLISSNKEWQE